MPTSTSNASPTRHCHRSPTLVLFLSLPLSYDRSRRLLANFRPAAFSLDFDQSYTYVWMYIHSLVCRYYHLSKNIHTYLCMCIRLVLWRCWTTARARRKTWQHFDVSMYVFMTRMYFRPNLCCLNLLAISCFCKVNCACFSSLLSLSFFIAALNQIAKIFLRQIQFFFNGDQFHKNV